MHANDARELMRLSPESRIRRLMFARGIALEPEEMLDFGNRIPDTTQQRGRGSGSGATMTEPVFQLFTFRRGLVVRQEDFLDRSEALQAARLSDSATRGD